MSIQPMLGFGLYGAYINIQFIQSLSFKNALLFFFATPTIAEE